MTKNNLGIEIINVEDKNKDNQMGSFIKKLRKNRNVTQHELGLAIGLSEDIALFRV